MESVGYACNPDCNNFCIFCLEDAIMRGDLNGEIEGVKWKDGKVVEETGDNKVIG